MIKRVPVDNTLSHLSIKRIIIFLSFVISNEIDI